MSRISVNGTIGQRNIPVSSKFPVLPKSTINFPRANIGGSQRVKKAEGVDELLQCLSPESFDFGCIAKNLDWLFNSALNTFYLNCALGPSSPDPGDPTRRVSSGTCSSWWGLPGVSQPQKCISYNASARSAAACAAKCATEGKPYEASGCDGTTIWCHCK